MLRLLISLLKIAFWPSLASKTVYVQQLKPINQFGKISKICFVSNEMRKIKLHAKLLWNGRVQFNEWNITEPNVDCSYLISGWNVRYHKRGGKRIQARSDEEKNSKQKIGSNEISFNTLKHFESLRFTPVLSQCSLRWTVGSTFACVCVSVGF